MDENGDPGVGLQESPKYRFKGGMMRGRNYFGLLVLLLFGFFTLLAPESAMATDIPCPDGFGGFQTHYSSPAGPAGTFCVEPKRLAEVTTCGTASCYRFEYVIRALIGESLSQVNLTIPAAEKFCPISILSPTERSVKIREYEPSTGFSLTDTNTDVITWDALKLDPSNKKNIDVYLTQTGAGPQVMQLKTATGPQYVDVDGPICCSTTQIPTAITFNPKAFGVSLGPTFNITYDSCTGDANTDDLINSFGYIELVNGAFVCSGDPCGPKDWNRIRKLGPRSGAALYTRNISTSQYASFFGFGNRIYQSVGGDAPAASDGCSDAETYEVVTFDNRIRVEFNSCGEPINVQSCVPNLDPPPALECSDLPDPRGLPNVYIAPGKPNGQPDTSQIFQILAGPRDGAIIFANPSYYCTVFGIGCYR